MTFGHGMELSLYLAGLACVFTSSPEGQAGPAFVTTGSPEPGGHGSSSMFVE